MKSIHDAGNVTTEYMRPAQCCAYLGGFANRIQNDKPRNKLEEVGEFHRSGWDSVVTTPDQYGLATHLNQLCQRNDLISCWMKAVAGFESARPLERATGAWNMYGA
jgi:hypothetical protein